MTRIVLVGIRVAVAAIAVVTLTRGPVVDEDVLRFHAVAGIENPYVAASIEYAPLETFAIRALAGPTPESTGTRLIMLALVADLAAAAAVTRGWGRRAGERYLWLGLPLLLFIYLRFDLVPVAMTAWSFALVSRGRHAAGGTVLGLAVGAKLWPLILFPALVVRGAGRAVRWAFGSAAAVLVGWVAFTSLDAIEQVVTFRGATGWGVESPIGTAIWLTSDGPIRLESGAPRIGAIPPWAKPTLAVLLVGVCTVIWLRAKARHDDAFGRPSLGAIAALLTLSPLFSLQYASWLLVPAAVSEVTTRSRAGVILTGGVTLATGVEYALLALDRPGATRAVLFVRALVVTAIVAWAFIDRPTDQPADQPDLTLGGSQDDRAT